MLQNTLTNLRTLSLALVMVVMLGVGVMTPVQQAAAQAAPVDVAQRAAMLEQINTLMALISQLMMQLQAMQSVSLQPSAPTSQLPIIFTNPSKKEYQAGETMDVKWTEDDGWYTGLKIENVKTGEVTFFRDALSANRLYQLQAPTQPGEYRFIAYNYQGIDEYVDYVDYGISRSFRVVADKDTEAQAELQRVINDLNSIGKKDADDIADDIDDFRKELEEQEERYEDVYQAAKEFNVDDKIEDLIEEVEWYLDEAEEQYEDQDYDLAENNIENAVEYLDELNIILDDVNKSSKTKAYQQVQINELLKMVDNPKNIPSAAEQRNMSEQELQNVITNLQRQIAQQTGPTTPTVAPAAKAPEKNAFNCNRSGTVAKGAIGCYGMWDYGNAFGGDVAMCGSYSGGTGCVIKTPVCSSGHARATSYLSNRAISNLGNNRLQTIATNLNTSIGIVQEEIAGLWEYTCIAPTPVSGVVRGVSTSADPAMVFTQVLSAFETILLQLKH